VESVRGSLVDEEDDPAWSGRKSPSEWWARLWAS
jgi:hypothetical protein